MKQFGFPKDLHLRSSFDFDRIYALRQRAGDRHLLVFAARNALEYTRVGLSVSRKHGNAVRRARIRRMLREAFRLCRHELPQGLDLILIPRIDSRPALSDYQGSLTAIARKLDDRLPPSDAVK